MSLHLHTQLAAWLRQHVDYACSSVRGDMLVGCRRISPLQLLFCTMMPVQAMRQLQMWRVIRPFLRWAILCESALLNHRAILAEQRSSCASGWWSRLGEWCTPGQPAHNPRGPRCACFRGHAAWLSAQWVWVDVPVAGAGAWEANRVIREGTTLTTRVLASG